MTRSNSFLNDIKIETVNAKFATSILNETLTKLALLQCSERGKNQRTDKLENVDPSTTKKFTTDLTHIRQTLNSVISDLREHRNFTDFSGVSVAEKESEFLMEYTSNNVVLEAQCAAIRELEKEISNYRAPTSTVDVSDEVIDFPHKSRLRQNHFLKNMASEAVVSSSSTYFSLV